jgi:glycerophosphoryl diester phosphodiesterase
MQNLLASLLLFSVPAMAIDLQGHRGARGLLPENTLPAFERAIALGVTTVELDVGVTRDGVVVIHHDRTLNPDLARGPDGQWVKAPAPTIFSLTFEQLKTYDVGRLRPGSEYLSRFKDQKPVDGTRIPKLEDVLKLDAKVRFNIETKTSPEAPHETLAPEPFARALIAEVRKAGVEKRTTIQSFDFRTLKVVEREAPEIATAYLTSKRYPDPARVAEAGARIWSPDFSVLNEETVKKAKILGLRIIPWTVNEPGDIARMLDMGVDGIISDYPDRVLAELKRRGR